MNKLYTRLVAAFTITAFAMPAAAQQELTAPPIIIHPAQESAKANAGVSELDRQRQAVTQSLEEREAQIKVLQARAEKTGPVLDQSVDASFAVGYTRKADGGADVVTAESPREYFQLQKVEQTLEDIKNEFSRADTRYEAAIKEYDLKIQAVVDQKEKVADREAKLDALMQAREKQVAEFKVQMEKATAEAERVRRELSKDDEAFARISKNGITMTNKIKEQEEALKAKDASIEEYKGQLVVVQKTAAHAEKIAADAAKTAEDAQKLKAAKAESDTQVATLTEQLAKAKAEAVSAQADVTKNADEIVRIKSALTKQQDFVAQSSKQSAVEKKTAQEEVVSLRAQLAEAKQAAASLQEGMNKDKEDIERIKQELSSAHSEVKNIADGKAISDEEKVALKAQLSSAQQAAASARENVSGNASELQRVKSELMNTIREQAKGLAEARAKSEIENVRLKDALAMARVDVDEAHAKFSHNAETLARIGAEIKALSATANSNAGRQAAAEKENTRLQEQLAAAQKETATLRADLQSKQNEYERTQTELNTQIEQSRGATQKIAAFNEEGVRLRAELKHLNAERAELQAKLDKDDEAFARIRKGGEELRHKIKQQQASMQASDADLSAARGQIMQMTGKLKEAEDISAHNAVLDKDLEAVRERMRLREELAARHRRHIELLRDKSQLLNVHSARVSARDEHTRLRFNRASAEWEAKSKSDEARIRNLSKDLELKEDQLAAAKRVVAARTTEKEDLYRMLDTYKARLDDSTNLTGDQSRNLAMYRSQAEGAEQELKHAQGELARKQKDVDDAQHEMDRLRQQLEESRQEDQAKDLSMTMMQSAMDAKTDDEDKGKAALNAKIKELEMKLAQSQEGLAVTETKLQQDNSVDTTQLANVQDMLKASREEIAMVNALLKERDSQIADLKNIIDSKDRDMSAGDQKNVDSMKAEIEDRDKDVGLLKPMLEQKEKQIGDLEKQLKVSSDEFSRQTKELETLKAEWEVKSKEQLNINPALAAKEKQIASMKKSIDSSAGELSRQSNDIELLKKDLEKQQAQIAGLKTDLSWKDKEIARLKAQKKHIAKTIGVKADDSDVAIVAELDYNQLRSELRDAREQIATLKSKLRQKPPTAKGTIPVVEDQVK